MTGNRGPNSFHMFRGEGWLLSSGSLNPRGPGSETAGESVSFSHDVPGKLPVVVAGLDEGWGPGWRGWGGSLLLMKSTCDSLKRGGTGSGVP